MRRFRHVLGPIVLLAGGCQEYFVGGAIDGAGQGEAAVLETPRKTDRIVQSNPIGVDVLWVVDNSCSMSDRQRALSTNFPLFLDMFLDSELDWHIGVVSTDTENPAQNGKLHAARDGTRYLDPTTPDPEPHFDQMVKLGTLGSGIEAGLRAAYNAIAQPTQGIQAANAGFYRDDAALHIIVVSDEEDQSGNQFQAEFLDFLHQLKPPEVPLTFSSIVELQNAGCGRADDGTRGRGYIETTDEIGGIISNICLGDWSPVLTELGEQAAGRKHEFFLSEVPVPGSIEVTVEARRLWHGIDLDKIPDGHTLEEACGRWEGDEARCFGFTYDPTRNSIYMPDWSPSPMATIVVDYALLSGLQQVTEEEAPADDEG